MRHFLRRLRAARYALSVTILGPFAGEPPEPMTKEQFEAARKRLRATLNGIVSIDKPDLQLVGVNGGPATGV
jgi:hypothetical protein